MKMPARLLVGLVLIHGWIDARTWTDYKGAALEADYVRQEGANVILRINGKETPYPKEKLSPADQAWISEAQAGREKTPQPAGKPMLGTVQLEIGKKTAFELPLLPEETKAISKATSGELHAVSIKAAVAVPEGFNPAKQNFIFIVSCSTNGHASSILVMDKYIAPALAKGWIVIAADGPKGRPKNDIPAYRFELQQRLLREINSSWPGSEKWPMAHAGFSGGGGYASYGTIMHVNQGKNIIGLFLGGSGWSPHDFIDSAKKTSTLRKVPIFYSIGDKDTVATPKIAQDTLKEIKSIGCRIVREEHYDGNHELYGQHIGEAVTWFIEKEKDAK